MKCRLLHLPVVAIGLGVLCQMPSYGADEVKGLPSFSLQTDQASVAVSPSQIVRAATRAATTNDWSPRANDEVSRGPAAVVYPKIAPATVLIRTNGGYGTGCIIDSKGWILSCAHVVESSDIDLPTGAQVVRVYVGHLTDDGTMDLNSKQLPAVVYKVDADTDLALLKLQELPPRATSLPIVTMAESAGRPGADCVAVGHPTSGLLWTVRSGEVVGSGTWPQDSIDVVMERLTASVGERIVSDLSLLLAPQRKVLVSSIGINPGDSGGPLVNTSGELIGVTFAIPQGGREAGISLDKFSYHVHVDDVRKFAKERPSIAPLFIPDPWPVAMVGGLMDGDGDEKADMWVFAMAPDQPMTGCLFDLDQDSPANVPERLAEKEKAWEAWDFELALQQYPLPRTFYDVDNDRQVDVIFTDVNRDDVADLILKRSGGKWERMDVKEKRDMIQPQAFRSEEMRARLIKVLQSEPKPVGKRK